jgi:hypothetical protein
VNTIQSWDEESDSAKVPSRIQFNGQVPVAWGFDLEDSETTFEWFKLILDYENLAPEIRSSTRVRRTYQKLRDWSKGDPTTAATTVTAHYLRLLWRHAITTIQDKEGQSWVDGVVCKVVITRPAIWGDKALDRTRRAAKWAILRDHAPFKSVSIDTISEPEAAAQAMLQAPAIAERPDVTGVSCSKLYIKPFPILTQGPSS